jgi:hypothetical protein
LRSHFSSSPFVRQLGEWTPLDAQASGMDFAERLSLWLNAFDAIGLQSAHQTIRAIKSAAPGKATDKKPVKAQAQALQQDLERVRSALAQAIAQDPMRINGFTADDDADAGYTPFQQRHLALQRQMEQMLSTLREHLRESLGRVSVRLRQLAALDAVLEQVLTPREQQLMPTAVLLLERRYEHLRRAHRQALDAAGQPDDPALWRRPGGWLDDFAKDWRQALLAELDLRLEPALGLLEALRNELKNLHEQAIF